jgi:hypothetical protein
MVRADFSVPNGATENYRNQIPPFFLLYLHYLRDPNAALNCFGVGRLCGRVDNVSSAHRATVASQPAKFSSLIQSTHPRVDEAITTVLDPATQPRVMRQENQETRRTCPHRRPLHRSREIIAMQVQAAAAECLKFVWLCW